MRLPTLMLLTLLGTLALAPPARAENSTRSGELVLHYSAIPSTTLTPEVARQYQITRSANRALVNVAIRRGEPGADRAVAAKVTIAVTNLSGQRIVLGVREVREGDAIYYLAEARFAGHDTLTFDVQALTEDGTPLEASFRQEFFPQ